ncbi:MAG: YkgJ family cysteine cluster protein [bacterium]|nr:YkgJ family cysteine cluster protein [bacterium]
MERSSELEALIALHVAVDEQVDKLVRLHGERLLCRRGCRDCCVDDLTVFELEADLIRTKHGALLVEGRPFASGACAFLDDAGDCRVYEHRPYVCRTQGLPLRWIEGSSEYRDICPLNDGQLTITELQPAACWLLGPFEGRLATLQAARAEGALKRVALRDLFG